MPYKNKKKEESGGLKMTSREKGLAGVKIYTKRRVWSLEKMNDIIRVRGCRCHII